MVCIFPDTLTNGVTKVPEGCPEGFWHFCHLITLGFLRKPGHSDPRRSRTGMPRYCLLFCRRNFLIPNLAGCQKCQKSLHYPFGTFGTASHRNLGAHSACEGVEPILVEVQRP